MRKWFLMDKAGDDGAGGAATGAAAGDGAGAGNGGDDGKGAGAASGASGAGASGGAAAGAAAGGANSGAGAAAGASGEGAGAAKGYWPDDWLSKVSKGDAKAAKDFGKFQSPEALADAYSALQKRFSSGDIRTALPKDAKPEEITAWRKDNGIPEKADGYDLKDMKIPKEDKPIVDAFLATAHSNHFSPEQAKAALGAYYDIQSRNADAMKARDETQRTATLDVMNQEWGGNFRRNVNLVEGVLSKFPASVRDVMKSARLPDGTAVFNSPDILRGFAALALEMNPAGLVAPAGGGDIGKVALDEYRDMQKMMRENRDAYNKDGGKQSRMRELIDHLSKNGVIDGNGNVIEHRKAA